MADLQDCVAEAAAELGVPGVAVGVDHGGREQILVHGATAVDHGRPIGPGTLFQLGSTAKTFTAAVIMVLADQGRVDGDQRVRRYLPELRLADDQVAETVTVGQLLNHTAGWDGGDSWPDTGEGDDALERAAALVAELPQQFAPGTAASYNNAAFVLAGRVIEKVTGRTYEQALAELLLQPLGMRATHTDLNVIMTGPYAIGHRRPDTAGDVEDRRLVACQRWSDPRGYLPAGARIASSITDLLSWARFQLGSGSAADGTRVLNATTLRAMHTPSTEHEVLPGIGVGIGWMLRRLADTMIIEHHGDVAGQHSSVTVVPDHRYALAVLTNATPSGRELAQRVVQQALQDDLGLVDDQTQTLRLEPAALTPYLGTYRTTGIELQVVAAEPADGTLVINGTITDGDGPGETLAFPIGLLPDDRFLVTGGPFAGVRGSFVRVDGTIDAVHHVGRLVPRA